MTDSKPTPEALAFVRVIRGVGWCEREHALALDAHWEAMMRRHSALRSGGNASSMSAPKTGRTR